MLTFGCRAGLTRRNFLTAGALGLTGLTLGDLLRVRAEQPTAARLKRKAVILVYLPGGPPHIDMYDLKPDAPAEVRGEFKPIRTRVPGLDVCELLPLHAQLADRFSVVRGIEFHQKDHNVEEVVCGYPLPQRRPAFGSVVSRLRGQDGLPPYVSFGNLDIGNPVSPEDPHYLGVAHRPFTPSGPGLQNLRLSSSVPLERLADRTALRNAFDNLNRDLDRQGASGGLAGMDAFHARALEMLRSPRTRDAFDLAREPDRVRDRYDMNAHLLMARRLVEAGVSVVTLGFTRAPGWDTHKDNFRTLRILLPELDRAVHALLTDLCDRGLHDDVAVLLWGEFGRSPRITADAGRDHWPEAGCALLSGGGLRMGQVVGATDRRGEHPLGRPCTPQNVLATLYHVLGIDPALTLPDYNGRPTPLLDERDKIEPLL
jgi:hypothetical protein